MGRRGTSRRPPSTPARFPPDLPYLPGQSLSLARHSEQLPVVSGDLPREVHRPPS